MIKRNTRNLEYSYTITDETQASLFRDQNMTFAYHPEVQHNSHISTPKIGRREKLRKDDYLLIMMLINNIKDKPFPRKKDKNSIIFVRHALFLRSRSFKAFLHDKS